MKTSSQQQMRLLFFKEDRKEGKVGVEKAPPSPLLLPGTVASAPSPVLRLLVQVDSRCPVPDAATPSALTPAGRPALGRGALCSLGCGVCALAGQSASRLSDHDASAASAAPSGCSDTLSGSSTLPGKSGTEARTQTFSRVFSRINDT